MRSDIDTAGFTLIESLVAVMILAICIVVIMQLFSGGLKSSMISDEYTQAAFHAQEKMEEILVLDKFSQGEWEGEFGDGYIWKSEIVLVEPEEGEAKLSFDTFDIKVDISWRKGNREKHFEVSTRQLGEEIKDET